MTAASTARNRRRITGGLLATAALAGCSPGTGGTPYPVTAAASSATESAMVAQLPKRPAELPLAGIDPCDIFAQVSLDELKISAVPRPASDAQDGPTCVLDATRTEPFHSYHLREVPADLTEWISGQRRKNSMTTEPKTVGGYPALVNYRAAGQPSDCETLVGVAQGQTLALQAFAVSAGKFTQPQLCEMSAHAAELALQNLKARK
ncbi:MAG TPA: DUF3558 domain-containing protein [Amycolatopsis sp.]|nr:DUF3558 domain-containing protein [Amycolatopsis sp.]